MTRLTTGGLIDRSISVPFRYDGHLYQGREGDTLASALMANGIRNVGRSFKYHRPRGIMTTGSEEPGALVSVGRGAAREPNLRATMLEIHAGLDAFSQNCWPSVDFDLLAVNDLFAPLLSAGFYYKTFMWPRAFWERIYEPMIRRAAGLGALSGRANEDPYEKAFAHCDLLVIGAGPGGLMAAHEAAMAGADVILADEDFRPGGRLNFDTTEVDGRPGAEWAAEMVARLRAMPNLRLMTRTTVSGAYDHGMYSAIERVGMHRTDGPAGLPRECFWRIRARRAILATGALERPIAFPGNDRPGVMMAGAVRGYVNRFAVTPGQSVALFGNNDSIYHTAADLLAAGVHVAGVIDARPDARTDLDVPLYHGQVVGTSGRRGIDGITIRTAKGREALAVDTLGISGGWNPSLHLSCHMNGRPVWSEAHAAFLPAPPGAPGTVPGLSAAGASAGDFSTHGALTGGLNAARAALADLGLSPTDTAAPPAEDAAYDITPLWQVPGRGRAWLDFANDVTTKDVKLAATEGYRSVEHMKRYTTQGMAPDQGKSSNMGALAVLADATGRSIPDTGTTTYRPPYVPTSIAAMGAGGQGQGFAPRRLTTSDPASRRLGAPMIEAGLWFRPSYFPKGSETTWRQSCDREVRMVRNTVGICDVSTLGKIDIQGPDAARFLDFVYTNTFSTLKPGRVRYGLMLREDGHVMDDGTTARLSDSHFLMTTTTAAAGEVMRHLEFVSQGLCPDMRVRMASVTEQWAQFAIAGPASRDLLNSLLDAPIDNEGFPFMACGEVRVMGLGARLFRISFSGEMAYELAVPARYGAALFDLLQQRGEALGGGVYGMEALNVLRIEKGFLTHAELHGRTTAFDLGMQGMMSRKKDFIGKAAAARPGMIDPARERLIGLKPIGAVRQLTAGAHLFNPGDEATRVNDQGYLTSVGFSPTLGHFIGLGFLRHGPDRIGDTVQMVDHLRGVTATCEVTDPVMFDQDGGRVHG